MPKYMVEHRFLSGWDDADWGIEEKGERKPWRFNSRKEAQDEIDDLIKSVKEKEAQDEIDDLVKTVKEAGAEGDMDDEYDPDDYRIVEVKEEV